MKTLKTLKENGDPNNAGQMRIVSSLVNQNNYTQINPLQSSHIHKLILYKPQSGSMPIPIENISNSHKSLKIVSTTPIMSNNKPNLLSSKITIQSLRQEETIEKPNEMSHVRMHIAPNVDESFKEPKSDESQKLYELLVATETQLNENDSMNQLKRKRSLSSNHNSPVFKELELLDASLSVSPPNWTEKNLEIIKEMLERLNDSNVHGTDEYFAATPNEILTMPVPPAQEQKRALKTLCETIKEKLEKNFYECVDDLNNDLKIVKERCIGNEENEASSKRVKLIGLVDSGINLGFKSSASALTATPTK